MYKLIIACVFYLCTLVAFAEKSVEYYYTSHIQSTDGLPHSLVFDITQCSNGFIWVATNNGLGRYDGYDFKTFRPHIEKPNTLGGKSISELFIDNNDQMWLSIQGMGMDRMDLKSQAISHYSNSDTTINKLSGNNVICYLQSTDSTIWLGTSSGLDKYEAASDRIHNCLPPHPQNKTLQLFEDNNGNIWLRTPVDIKRYNPNLSTFTSINELTKNPRLSQATFSSIKIVNSNLLIISTKTDGLFIYDINSNTIKHHYADFKSVNDAFVSTKGDLYFISYSNKTELFIVKGFNKGHENPLLLFDFEDRSVPLGMNYCEDANGNIWFSFGESLFKLRSDYSISEIKSQNEEGVLSQNIFATFIDKMNNLWLQSDRNGIIMIDLNQKQFATYKSHKNNNDIISGNNISMVFEDSKENIWVGCHSIGLTCYNRKKNEFTNYYYHSINNGPIKFRAPAGIAEDEEGNIWVGFYDGELQCINPTNNTIDLYSFSQKPGTQYFLDVHSIRSIVRGHNGNLWLATNTKGVVELDTKNHIAEFHSIKHENNYQNNSHYRFITQSKDGIIWTGTQNGGLGKYDRTSNTFIHYTHQTNNKNSISGNTVYFVHEQNDSILWLATDKGLNTFNRNTEVFSKIKTTDGNNLCAVYRIYPDKKNNLWLSGDCGLFKYNIESSELTNYKYSDGLPGNEFNTTAGCLAKDGTIFFGTSSGLVSFHPDKITNNPYEARPVITELKMFNKLVEPMQEVDGYQVLKNNIAECDGLKLPYYLNDFTLEFSSLHLASPNKNTYQYKLEGFNDDWINTNADRRWANFTGLEPGEYRFVLRASNSDGIMCSNNNEVHLNITITPPLHKTLPFKIILVLLLILLGYTISRLRIKTIKKQKIKLERQVNKRTLELKTKNQLLEESRHEISQKNEELSKHQNELERLVVERTAYLNDALVRAEESDRLKSSFLSNISHEVRTPMNAIVGFSEIIREGDLDHDDICNYLKIISSNTDELLMILNDIIDMSKIEAAPIEINKSNIEISELVRQVIDQYAIDNVCIAKPEVKIIHKPLKHVANTDPLRLTQVLNHLINNALKFTTKGTITINYMLKGNTIEFAIKDTGIGIEEDHLSKIFNRFYKVEESSKNLYRGNGIGLCLSKNLVKVLGGEIWVESKPKQGSTFYFSITHN